MKRFGRVRKMSHRLSRTAALTLGCLGMLLGGATNAATVTTTTEPFRLSIQHDDIRPSTGDETLTYSDLWDGGADATVTLAQEGVPLAEGLTGEGERVWSVARNGTYTLTHTTYTNGVVGKVETATFVVTGRDVPFGAADVAVSGYTGVYDGQPHGIGVTVAEGIAGAAKRYATHPSAVFMEEPPTLTDVGSLTVWCEISAPGYITQTNSATVIVTPRPIMLSSKSATKVYDGMPLTAHEVVVGGNGFVDGEGVAYAFAGSQTVVGTSENTFTYNLNGNTKAGNYEIATVNGSLTVTKASIGGGEGGGDEPGDGGVPDGGLSKFDAAFVYDGAGHTIDTNTLAVAFGAAMIGENTVEYAAGGSQSPATVSGAMNCVPPCFTNAGEYVVWYRVTNPNYEDFVHRAKVTIAKRPVTLTSGTKLDFVYDGQPHVCPHFIKSGQDFVSGEGVTASNWATVTTVSEGEVANTFDYAPLDGTDLGNYELTIVTGRIAVITAPIPVGPSGVVTAVGYTNVYDGLVHGVDVSVAGLLTVPTVQYRTDEADAWADASPVYSNVCDTQVWYRVSAPNYEPVVGAVGIRVAPRPVTLTSKSAAKVYDGTPLTAHEVAVGGDGFTDGEGAAYAFTGSQTTVGTSENTFTYALNGKTSAGNYEITTVNGTLTVTKASIGGGDGGGGEPGSGEVPEGGLSKFDAAFVYDGEGHTINTNALQAAFGAVMIGENTVEYAEGGSQSPATVSGAMNCVPPCFTNAGEYVVWYRVTNPNYEDFVHRAKVTITKRPVTLTSGTKLDFVYDGQPHACPHFIKSGQGFVAGEGIETFNWATVTCVDEGEVPNTFTYATQEGTDLANYAVTVVTGKIAVVKATYDMTNVAWNYAGPFTYDGTTKCVELAGLPEGVSAVYTDNEKSAAGTYVAKATFAYDAVNHHAPAVADCVWEIAKAPVGPGGGVEPGDGEVPEGGLSRFDMVAMYDGTGHTVDTNGLVAAFSVVMGGGETWVDYGYAAAGAATGVEQIDTWSGEPPVYTNAGEYVVWYKVTNPNYEDFVHRAKVTIAKRPVTLTSGTKLDFVYDGQPHAFPHFIKSGQDFVEGEGIVASNWATVTRVDEGEVANTFDNTAQEGTDLANYEIAVVTGRIAVVTAPIPIGPGGAITAVGYTNVYDGAAHGVAVSVAGLLTTPTVQYRADEADAWTDVSPVFGDVCGTQVWYRVSAPNYAPVVGSVGVRITPRPVTLTSKSATKVYDGMPLTAHEVVVGGDGFVGDEGAAYAFAGSQTVVGTSENTFTYTLNEKTAAGNYNITVENGSLTVTKASIGGGEGDGNEPGDGGVPEGGLSKFDAAFVYDGAGHTIDTNTLAVAFGAAMIGENTVEYAAGGSQSPATVSGAMNCVPPCFTNAGEYVVWYRVTNPNYEDFVHRAKVTITKRPVTLTSGTKLDFVYDGQPHAFPHFIKSGQDFVEGEGIVASNWATVTRVDEGEVANTFDNTAQEGTDLANYEIAVVTGRIAVVTAPIPIGPGGAITAIGYTNVYDGAAHGVAVSANGLLTVPMVQYRTDEADAWADVPPRFDNVCDTQVWYRVSAPNYAPVVGSVGVRIAPRPVTLMSRNLTKSYDGTPLTLTAADITVSGIVDGESLVYSDFATRTEVGRTSATFSYAAGVNTSLSNYEITPVYGLLTVTQSATEITVTAKSGSWAYDGQPHTLHGYDATNRDVLQPGDELVVAFDAASVVTTPVDGAAGDGRVENRIVGVRVMRGDLDVSANYTLAFYSGTLTVTKRPVTLTSKSATKVYDGTPLTAHEATVGGDGFVGGDGVTYTFTGSQTVKGTSKNTFAYVLRDGTNAAFYDITKVEGDLEVMAADITQGDDADWQIVLGPALTYTGSEQVQVLVSATYKGLPLDYVVTGNAQTDVGTYQMTLTGQGNFTGEKTVDWSISPKPLTLTAGGGSKVYDGTALAVGTVTAEGFVTGEGADFTCVGSQKDVGHSANEVDTIRWNANTKDSNYVVTKVLGTLTITPRQVTLTSKDGTKVYDGTPLTVHEVAVGGGGFVEGEGATYVFTGEQTAVGTSENTFTYTLDGNTKVGNYEIFTVNGTLIVTKANIGDGDDDEPGDGDVPDGGLSKFDAAFVYDGAGHTVDTNTLVEAFVAALPGAGEIRVNYGYAVDGTAATEQEQVADWREVAPVYTNAGEYVVWYRVTNPNYEDFVHRAKVTVSKRPVTLTSGAKTDFVYDGTAHSYPYIEVSGQGFVAGEGVTTSNWATVTRVAEGEVANTFDYAPLEGTDFANYAITIVTGRIAVVAAPIPVGLGGAIVASGYTNVYDGAAHGVAVSASGLLTTPTVQYRTDEADAWTDALPTFGDVCDTQVWYRISAPNYTPVVGSVGVRIAPRPVTLMSRSLTKSYDGTPLILTAADITVSGIVDGESLVYSDFATRTEVGRTSATFSYAAGVNTSLSNYEITPAYGMLTVTKAVIGGGGEEPGDGEIPDGGFSKFDATSEYDGEGHTIDTNALVAAFTAAIGGESAVEYAEGGAQFTTTVLGAMNCVPPCFTNAGEYVVWYRVTNSNYEDFIHQAKVTITPRDITKATIAPIPDVTFANRPVMPLPIVIDQTPSIIKASDYVVSYRDNDRPGTATVTVTGTGNYRGTKSATFVINPVPVLYAALRGTLAWKLNTGTGCYTAQLKLTCTNGFDQGISDLKFIYQDRRDGAKIMSGLWDSSARAYRPTVSIDGTTYRFVDLDAARITGQNVTALYGVRDIAQSIGMIPSAECAIELFVGNLSTPISDIGYVVWKSNGMCCTLPVSAAGGSQGMAVGEAMLKAVRMAASVPLPGVPLSLSALNTSFALGVVVDPASSPYCRLTDFTVSATNLAGRIEVGKENHGIETKGVLGTNACVIFLGAKNLADGFTELGRVSVDDGGAFRFALRDKGCHFFRVRIEIKNVVE